MQQYEIPMIGILPINQTFLFCPEKRISINIAQEQELSDILNDFILGRLTPWCTEFSNDSFYQLFNIDSTPKNLRFIYRIYPDLNWAGEFIIQAVKNGCHESLFSSITCGSQRLTEWCCNFEMDISAQNIIFLKIAKIFVRYYQKKGRIYPAYIQLNKGAFFKSDVIG